MTNREIAEQIVRDWCEVYLEMIVDSFGEMSGSAIHMSDAITAALDAKLPPPGHIITDDGTVRKVLGTLPVTADGRVLGDWASVFVHQLNGDIGAGCTRTTTYSWTATTPGRAVNQPYAANTCYSTREAAEAARAKP